MSRSSVSAATGSRLTSCAADANRRWKRVLVAATTVAAVLLAAPAASAESVLDREVSVAGTQEQACFTEDLASDAGTTTDEISLPGASIVEATLDGDGSDDWDVAVLERETGNVIAASAETGSDEVASGYTVLPTEAVVRACRRSGDGSATLSVGTIEVDTSGDPARTMLVNVETPTREDKELLQSLPIELTEHGGEDFVGAVLHGPEVGGDLLQDEVTLLANGLDYTVEINDLARQSAQDREAEKRFATSTRAQQALPSGSTEYRRLFDYNEEMKQLAEDNPDLVESITLPFQTYEGRRVEGIEITTNPEARDGKPVYLQMGVHHAREWPSGEHAIEYAYELIEGYRNGDERIANLVENTRTIVVPIVNPDGFNVSRETGELQGGGDGRDSSSYNEVLAQLVAYGQEYWRKNCRLPDDSDAGTCMQPGNGVSHPGVDPNRNYGGFWGGPGASDVQLMADYRGPGPFSEPETQNIQQLISANQVTTLITNHTFSNLVLRPPGQAGQPDTPDEPRYRELGEQMAAENGYVNQRAYELYDTTGSTEDWSYYSTGGFGYTFEIGCEARLPEPDQDECDYGNFHGPYQDVVAEYNGTTPTTPQGGGGNREAYLIAHENALAAEQHSVIEGQAPSDAVIRVQKTFLTDTWCSAEERQDEPECEGRDEEPFPDHLETAMDVPGSGNFEFHVNPSTRPVVEGYGRQANGDPSDPQSFEGSPSGGDPLGPPQDGAAPCGNFETQDTTCFNDHPFTVPPNGGGTDNAAVNIRIEWETPASDWDLRVYRDSNGDGSSAGEEEVGQSAQGAPTTSEEVSLIEPNFEPGDYVARVVNFAATDSYDGSVTFEGPAFQEDQDEAWQLTCERDGEVVTSQPVFVDRGESASLDLTRACARDDGEEPPPGNRPSCRGSRATIVAERGEPTTGTRGPDVIVGTGGDDRIDGVGGDDKICARGGEDTVRGGARDDALTGGAADDLVLGGGGSDRVGTSKGDDAGHGGAGPDRLIGSGGVDRLRGDRGSDVVLGSAEDDMLRGDRGDDSLSGHRGDDALSGGDGRDRCRGGAGRDTARFCER